MDRATVRFAHFYSGFEGSSLDGDCNHPTIRRNRQAGRHCPNDPFIIPPILTRRVRRAVSQGSRNSCRSGWSCWSPSFSSFTALGVGVSAI